MGVEHERERAALLVKSCRSFPTQVSGA